MKFASVKHALGWYVARRKGPAQVKGFNPGDRATKTPFIDNTMAFIAITQLLHYPNTGLGLKPGDRRLKVLLEWASTSDEAGIEPDPQLVSDLGVMLEAAGLLNRVDVPEGAYYEFEDLNTGEVITTWKEKKA